MKYEAEEYDVPTPPPRVQMLIGPTKATLVEIDQRGGAAYVGASCSDWVRLWIPTQVQMQLTLKGKAKDVFGFIRRYFKGVHGNFIRRN